MTTPVPKGSSAISAWHIRLSAAWSQSAISKSYLRTPIHKSAGTATALFTPCPRGRDESSLCILTYAGLLLSIRTLANLYPLPKRAHRYPFYEASSSQAKASRNELSLSQLHHSRNTQSYLSNIYISNYKRLNGQGKCACVSAFYSSWKCCLELN